MDDLPALRLALSEAQNTYRLVLENNDALEAKARALLGSASLVIAIFTAFELDDLVANPFSQKGIAALAILILYLFLVRDTASSIRPIEISVPMAANKPEYKKRVFEKTEGYVLKMLIASYLRSSNKLMPLLDKRATTITRAVVLLVVVIGILITTPFLQA